MEYKPKKNKFSKASKAKSPKLNITLVEEPKVEQPKEKPIKEKQPKEKAKKSAPKIKSFSQSKARLQFLSVKAPKLSSPEEKPVKEKVPKAKTSKEKTPKSASKVKSFSRSKSRVQLPQLNVKWKLILSILLAVLLVAGGIITAVCLTGAHNNTVVSIAVTAQPEKYVYFVGQEADYTGLEITATRRSGETFLVPLAECEIIGFTSEYPVAEKVLMVKYEGCSALFSVEIRERPKPTPTLLYITLFKMPKTEYAVGDSLSVTGGMIYVEYENALPKYLTLIPDMVEGYQAGDGAGEYVITVTYYDRELNQSATTTYTITVTE